MKVAIALARGIAALVLAFVAVPLLLVPRVHRHIRTAVWRIYGRRTVDVMTIVAPARAPETRNQRKRRRRG